MNQTLARYLQGYESKYPHQLERGYNRVLEKIVQLWETTEMEPYFNELMMGGGRASRQGFPADVAMEIFVLSVAYEEIRRKPAPESEDVWDVESQAVTIAALNALPLMGREAEAPAPRKAAEPAAATRRIELQYGDERFVWENLARPFLMGRDRGADLQLLGDYASRQHARLERREDGVYLVDQSRNGTYVTVSGHGEFLLRNQEVRLPTTSTVCLSFGVPQGDDANVLVSFSLS